MEQNEQFTVNDIKAIKDYEHITDEEATNILYSVKQLALIMYEYRRKGKYEQKKATKPNCLHQQDIFYRQISWIPE